MVQDFSCGLQQVALALDRKAYDYQNQPFNPKRLHSLVMFKMHRIVRAGFTQFGDAIGDQTTHS